MKKTILLIFLNLGLIKLNFAQQSTAIHTVGTVANIPSTGSYSWNTSQFGSFANILSFPTDSLTDELHFSNFTFTVPTTANILGVEAILTFCVMPQTSGNAILKDSVIKLLVNGNTAGNNQGGVHSFTPIVTSYTYGSSGSTWGTTLTPSDVNSSNFGFMCQLKSIGTATAFVGMEKHWANSQTPKMTIYYEESTVGLIKSQTAVAKSYYYDRAIYINNNIDDSKFEVYNLIGRKEYEITIEKNQSRVNLNHLKPGVYFYKLRQGKNEITQKFLVE